MPVASAMRHDSYALMIEHVSNKVEVGKDVVRSDDDPMTRTVGFSVSGGGGSERHFVALTASQEGLDAHQKEYLASGQEGRARLAALMTHGIPKHGHGFGHSRECTECLALDVMES